MVARAHGTYAGPAYDVMKVAGANKTVGDVDVITTGGVALWLTTTASGAKGTIRLQGPAVLPCATGVAFDAGDFVYWDGGSSLATVTATDTPVGFCLADKAAGAGLNEVEVCIHPFES